MTDIMNMVNEVINEVTSLYGEMRYATPEERKSVNDYIEKKSKDTGINLFDIFGEGKGLKGLCAVCSKKEDCDTAKRNLKITSCGDFNLHKKYNIHLSGRNKGVWIRNTVGNSLMQTCSVCGEKYNVGGKFMQFCPNCGTKMDFQKSLDLISRSEAVFEIKKAFEKGDCYCDKQSIVGIINSLTSYKSCEGCKHKGKWENEIEYGYNSPCTNCMRRLNDNYRRITDNE